MRALPVAFGLLGRARAWKRDADLGNRLAGQAVGLLGRDGVRAVIGRQDAGRLPGCGPAAREQVIDLAGAGDAGIGAMILIRDHGYGCEDRAARRVGEGRAAWPPRWIWPGRCARWGSCSRRADRWCSRSPIA